MALLTAEDILNKKVTATKFREGYDVVEVDDFLDEVLNTLRALQGENDDLKSKLAAAERRVAELTRENAAAVQAASAPSPCGAEAAGVGSAPAASMRSVTISTGTSGRSKP